VSPDRGRQLWLVPVLLVTVIATAIGGLLARQTYSVPEEAGAQEAVISSETNVPPEDQPGSGVVRGTKDATAHPLFENVRRVLQVYFDAINNLDYERWSRTVTQDKIESQSKDEWLSSYRSTRDGSIVIYRIELAGDDAARVLMKFTSTQEPSDGPPELRVGCIHWNVVLAMVREDSGWKIDGGTTGVSPQTETCA
jgi:hypothetical protein